MFSGQGPQYFQMGQSFFEQNAVFRSEMLAMDKLVMRLSGNSVVHALYSGAHRKSDRFDMTMLTHPAIFMVEYSLARALAAAGVLPQLTLGVSLGSFAAAAVSGFMTAEAALTAVVQQARDCEAHCPPGGMIVVLAELTHFDRELSSLAELAAVNARSHFVVSAPRAECEAIEEILRRRDIAYARLPVSFAFHSRWIDEARQPYEGFLHSLAFETCSVPMACSAQPAILTKLSRNYFWLVARQQIRFPEIVAKVSAADRCRFIDLGPSGSLALLLKQLPPTAGNPHAYPIMTPYGRDSENLAMVMNRCKTSRTPP